MQIYSLSEIKLNQNNESFIIDLSLALEQLSRLPELKRSFAFLNKQPWFFVLGHQGAGKTTLVKESEQHFIHEWHDPKMQFSFYFGESSVFVEIAEKFLTGSQAEAVWQKIQEVFKRYRISFSGLLLCASLHQLLILPKMQRQGALNDIKRIMGFVENKKEIPIWLLFTFLDIVNGFKEFFDDQLDLERKQSFGIEIQKTRTGEELIELFNKEFQCLLDQINQRLIRCLHNIRDQEKRILANDFPMQFEQLASLLRNVLRHLFKQEQYIRNLQGVYFTSGKQSQHSIDRIVKPISKQVVLSTPLVSAKKRFSRGYFIHDVLTHQIFNHRAHAEVRKRDAVKLLQVGISALALVTTLTLAYSFKKQVNQLSYIENAIQGYKRQIQFINVKNDNELIELLSAVENINQIQANMNAFNKTWMVLPFLSQLKQLKETVSHAYQEVLARQLLPRMSLQFENILNNADRYSDAEVYSALKGYIMLMDKKRFDPVYVSLWFRMHWEHYKTDILSKRQIESYSERLYELLKQNIHPAQMNHQLVFKIRQRLKDLSLPKIVFLKVKNLSDYSGYHLEKIDDLQIPAVFTKKGYRAIYLPQVEKVLGSFDRGDWVLGHLPDVQPGQMGSIREQIDALYFDAYQKWWLSELKQVQIPTVHSLQEAQQIALKHSTIDNQFFNIINTLIINTEPFHRKSINDRAFNDTVSRKFKAYHKIKASTLSALVEGFYDLGHDLQALNQSLDPNEQAFHFVKSRFASNHAMDPLTKLFQTAQKLPDILQTPMRRYAQEVWFHLIQQSEQHIHHVWHDEIIPFYHARIDKKYPLQRDAAHDVQLEDFAKFFGYGGVLDTFFEEHIMPFIETDQTRWRHSVKNNLYLSFSESIIEQFERAYIIRKMFFTQKTQKPYFKFSLQPLKFSSNVSSVVIDFSGQQVYDYQGSHKVTSFTWPGNQGSHYITILLENYKGDIDTIKYIGPWALLRLAQSFPLENTQDIEKFNINFKAKHGSSYYRLSTDSKVNPFISNIIEKFALDETIFEVPGEKSRT